MSSVYYSLCLKRSSPSKSMELVLVEGDRWCLEGCFRSCCLWSFSSSEADFSGSFSTEECVFVCVCVCVCMYVYMYMYIICACMYIYVCV